MFNVFRGNYSDAQIFLRDMRAAYNNDVQNGGTESGIASRKKNLDIAQLIVDKFSDMLERRLLTPDSIYVYDRDTGELTFAESGSQAPRTIENIVSQGTIFKSNDVYSQPTSSAQLTPTSHKSLAQSKPNYFLFVGVGLAIYFLMRRRG
jgi:hypothetical protein